MSFAPIRLLNLRDELVGPIREAILTGKLQPGDRIVESKLAREMGVSQNSVREALIVLEQQGLVTRVANRGAFVTKLSPEAMEQIYMVRIELEGLAVKFAKQHMRLADVDRLQESIEAMGTAARNGDRVAFLNADLEYHQRLWEFSNNPYLVKALTGLVAPQFSYLLIESFRVPAEHLLAVVEQHQQMLNLIKNASAETAVEGVKQMIQGLRGFAMPLLRQLETERSTTGSEAETKQPEKMYDNQADPR